MAKRWKQAVISMALIGSFSPVQAAQRGGVVKIVSIGEPQLLNPVFDQSASAQEFYNLIYAGLIRENTRAELEADLLQEVPTAANGQVVMNPDGSMSVHYRLRSSLKWQDGHDLTSADVLFTWQVHTDPKIVYPSTPGYEKIRQIEIIDKQRFRVHFYQPYGDYYKLFAQVLPRHSFRSQHWAFAANHPFNRHPVGSGPFVLKEWIAGKSASLDANPLYHRAKPLLDQIRYRFEPDSYRTIKDVLNWADQADVLRGMSLASYEYLKNRPDLALNVVPTGQIEHLVFNLKQPILADLRVRQALAYATDRRAIADLLLGISEPAYSDQLKASWKYNPSSESYYAPNLNEARTKLQLAGWNNPSAGELRSKAEQALELSLTLAQGNRSHQVVGQYLQKVWGEAGVKLNLKTVSPEVMQQGLNSGDFELAFATWNQDSAETPFARWHSTQAPPQGRNFGHFRDYQVDALSRELDRSVNTYQQERLYGEIADILAENLPALPLYYGATLEAHKKDLHNYLPNVQMGTTWNAASWWLE